MKLVIYDLLENSQIDEHRYKIVLDKPHADQNVLAISLKSVLLYVDDALRIFDSKTKLYDNRYLIEY